MAVEFESSFDSLIVQIEALRPDQLAILRDKYPQSYIEMYLSDIRDVIAREARSRIQSKIALTFHGGWSVDGNNSLMDSITYSIDGDTISLTSTKNHFAILNKGFSSFDMKPNQLGQTVKMRLPGGAVIYRRVGDDQTKTVKNLNTHLRTKKGTMRQRYTTKNWIHPGYRGQDIYGQVEREMEQWTRAYVNERIQALLNSIPQSTEPVPTNQDQVLPPIENLKKMRRTRGYWRNIFGLPDL